MHSYRLRFAPDQLPPVNAFWSLTLYELPASLLYANPIDRYLINSTMLPALTRDPDGGVTLDVQHDAPSEDRVSNWLPASNGPFFAILRLYWPKAEALRRMLLPSGSPSARAWPLSRRAESSGSGEDTLPSRMRCNSPGG